MTAVVSSQSTVLDRTRLEEELSARCRERAMLSAEVLEQRSMGDLENNDAYHRASARLESLESRIAQLYAALSTADAELLDDGTVQVGSIVTVTFDGDPADSTTFLVGAPEQYALVGMDVCSPESPLGAAVLGAATGETRTYELPNGKECSVTVTDQHVGVL